MRSFSELTKRKDELTTIIREVFGDRSVGVFGVGITLTPVKRFKRKRREQVESDGTSDEHGSKPASDGVVREIVIEARRLSGAGASSGMYLSNWEGYADLDCSWVRESGMSKATKDWWSMERTMRYPGYSNDDYPLYDEKSNSLNFSPSNQEFLNSLALPLHLHSVLPERTFLSLVVNPEFNAWNFVLALSGETSLDLFFTITETLVDVDRKVPIDEKAEVSTSPPPRRLRLIVSSSSSDEEDQKAEAPVAAQGTFRFRGQPAFLVREIRGERVVRGKTEYHVFWQGYDSSEATWEPAANVNKEAVNIWRASKRK